MGVIEKLLHEILSEALRARLDSEDFADALIAAYGYRPSDLRRAGLVSKLKELMGALAEEVSAGHASVTGDKILGELLNLRRGVRRAYLVDNMGLPEIYTLARKFGYPRLVLKVIINERGNTQAFKDLFGVDIMRNLSSILGTQLIKGQDSLVHEGEVEMDYEELLKWIARLSERLLDLVGEPPVLLIADHGYDVEKRGDKYKLCHGIVKCSRAVLSVICPIVLIS